MNNELSEIVDEAVYRAMLTERPSLVRAIADCVAQGQTPAQIERQMGKTPTVLGGMNFQMLRNVRHIAEYLARH